MRKMYKRCFSSTSRRLALAKGDVRKTRQAHWSDEIKKLGNINRALSHYDDFYAGVFGQQWPSLRLGLLSPPKYFAVPNSFTGNIDEISNKLREQGAYDVRKLWEEQQTIIERERSEVDLKRDLGRLHQMDRTIEAIAATKRAEEVDVLYQNAPISRRQEVKLGKAPIDSRVVSDLSQAIGDYVPSTKLKGVDDFTFDSEYFTSYLKKHETPDEDSGDGEGQSGENAEIKFLKSTLSYIEFPKLLVPHSFENGSNLMFPAAGIEKGTGFREYICVNGASLVPVMALDLKPGHNFLDLCAGPGTKSVLSLMTMAPDSATLNDVETSRLKRVQRILKEFTGSTHDANISYTKYNARDYPARQEFSRVLADVPCLNDRVSCTISDNNIFKPRRTKERLSLVKTQRDILLSGFRALERKEGSTIVYSTCTLSPVENDGVVMNALKETEIADLHIDQVGLVKLITPFERAGLFRTMRTRCGILVLPTTVCNFGPMYISKIVMIPSAASESTPHDDDSSPNPSEDFESESQQGRRW